MIIAAMPAYNEEKYIFDLVCKVKKYANEVIVLDDGSVDKTSELAAVAGATIVRHKRNLGCGTAIINILSEARKRSFDTFVILDADTQHCPSDIPTLANSILNGNDLVIGSRDFSNMPRYRFIGSKVLSLFTFILSGKNISDTQSGFRAFSPKAIRELQLSEKGMSWASEMISEATKKHLRIAEVPVTMKHTKDGSTHNPVAQGFSTLSRIIVMIVKRRILK